MFKLKEYCYKIAKEKRGSNYWLRFEIRTKDTELKVPDSIRILYPKTPSSSISIEESSEAKLRINMESNFAYPKKSCRSVKDQVSHFIKLIYEQIDSTDNLYFVLSAEEDDHPTPGIFWDFWYLIVPNNGGNVMCISGSACD